jgi:ligand-binding sensor domain-containing protein
MIVSGGTHAENGQGRTGSAVTGPKFVVYRPDQMKGLWRVNNLLEDHAGTIWCGTDQGLYRLIRTNQGWTLEVIDLRIVQPDPGDIKIKSMVEDRHGALWVATSTGLYRRWPDGHTDSFTTQNGLPETAVTTLLKDRDGRLWWGRSKGYTG